MTEAQSTQRAMKIPKRSYRPLYDMAVMFVIFPAIALVAARRTRNWPYLALGFVSIGIPFLLIGVRAWKRWFRPGRPPLRWPKDYRLTTNLQTLDSLLSWIWLIGIATTWVFDRSSHHRAYIAFGFIACAAAAWDGLLTKYIADRKYIPPPSPDYDPSKTRTSGMKPFHSEHWARALDTADKIESRGKNRRRAQTVCPCRWWWEPDFARSPDLSPFFGIF